MRPRRWTRSEAPPCLRCLLSLLFLLLLVIKVVSFPAIESKTDRACPVSLAGFPRPRLPWPAWPLVRCTRGGCRRAVGSVQWRVVAPQATGTPWQGHGCASFPLIPPLLHGPHPGLQAWQKPKLRPLAQAAAVEAHRQPGAPVCTVGSRRKEHGLPLNEAWTGDPLRGQLDGASPVLDFTSSPAPPPPQPTHTNPLGIPSRRFSTGSFDTLITQPKQAGIDPHER